MSARRLAAPALILALAGLAGLAAAPSRAQLPPECEAATAEGERLRLVVDAPRPGATASFYEPSCPLAVEVRGEAVVGARLFDFYLTLDSSGSTGSCTGTDIDEDGEVGFDQPFLGCSDPGDTILAAEVRAFRDFVDELDPARSRVAILQFSNPEDGIFGVGARQRIVQPLTSDFAAVDLALDEVLAAGSAGATDYEGGLELIREELATNGDPANRRQVAYFVSDGVPTWPAPPFNLENPTDSLLALDAADRAAMDGLTVNSFGVGFTPSSTLDPTAPPRCQVTRPGGLVETASTLECIALRSGGEFFASNDPADILEQLLLTRPAGIESVTVFNDTTGDVVEADLRPDGGWLAAEVPAALNEINFLRVLVVATDGTECEAETDWLPLCFPAGCEPRTQGYWHRQCLGLGMIDKPGGRPGRHPDWRDEILLRLFENVTDPLVAALGSESDRTTCEGLDAEPRRDPCQRAIKQYTALLLNIHGGFLGPDCELDLSRFGLGEAVSPAEAAETVAGLIEAGLAGEPAACRAAAAIADWINTGRALD